MMHALGERHAHAAGAEASYRAALRVDPQHCEIAAGAAAGGSV